MGKLKTEITSLIQKSDSPGYFLCTLLKQNVLLSAIAWKFTIIKLVVLKTTQLAIRSDSHMEMNKWIPVYGKVLRGLFLEGLMYGGKFAL